MNSKILATDLDDCLSPSFSTFLLFLEARLGRPLEPVDPSGDYWSIPPAYGITTEALFEHFSEWIHVTTPENLHPIDGSVETMLALANAGWELHIISARDDSVLEPTNAWVKFWFPSLFANIHYCSHWGMGTRREKFSVLNDISATHFMDDATRHLEKASGEVGGLQTILFGEYAWNSSDVINPALHESRSNNWSEVGKLLL